MLFNYVYDFEAELGEMMVLAAAQTGFVVIEKFLHIWVRYFAT